MRLREGRLITDQENASTWCKFYDTFCKEGGRLIMEHFPIIECMDPLLMSTAVDCREEGRLMMEHFPIIECMDPLLMFTAVDCREGGRLMMEHFPIIECMDPLLMFTVVDCREGGRLMVEHFPIHSGPVIESASGSESSRFEIRFQGKSAVYVGLVLVKSEVGQISFRWCGAEI
ncbi:hypothetical protein AVEN_108991-1 [Araneus ventricosus]|uniref:Uncharacterized protein n=1 Tax=Araneus ventricosus TaxID=182803 RepID=A0A4Y2QM76_ARAVE|nr:hypothetical protein AVEN_108991-1 [Araneus ventricosus]